MRFYKKKSNDCLENAGNLVDKGDTVSGLSAKYLKSDKEGTMSKSKDTKKDVKKKPTKTAKEKKKEKQEKKK